MSDQSQVGTSRMRYDTPKIERIGSYAEITAASGGSGNDSFYGYAEGERNPSYPGS
jgi:hypothetical protein